MNNAFLTIDFKLPDHSDELLNAAEAIEKIKIDLNEISLIKILNDNTHEIIFERIIRILDYIGNLSEPSFEIEDDLEKLYTLTYPHSPELAKKLWQDHYEAIHHPYDLLKNRCFRLIELLDAQFHMINKRHPKNWNP